MKEKDLDFLRVLMENPKATDEEIARKIKISRSAVAKRRTKLDKENLISYFAAPNPNKIKYRLVSGYFKFAPHLAFRDLIPFAKEFSKDENCLSVWIRKVSGDAYGICFQYLKDPSLHDEELVDEWKQKLNKEFGPDFDGYSIATPTYVFKLLGKIFDPMSD